MRAQYVGCMLFVFHRRGTGLNEMSALRAQIDGGCDLFDTGKDDDS